MQTGKYDTAAIDIPEDYRAAHSRDRGRRFRGQTEYISGTAENMAAAREVFAAARAYATDERGRFSRARYDEYLSGKAQTWKVVTNEDPQGGSSSRLVGASPLRLPGAIAYSRGRSGQRVLVAPTSTWGPIQLLEGQLSRLAVDAGTLATRVSGEDYGRKFAQAYTLRSKYWDPQIARDVAAGNWNEQARAHITNVPGGAQLLAAVDGAAADLDLGLGVFGWLRGTQKFAQQTFTQAAASAVLDQTRATGLQGFLASGRYAEARSLLEEDLFAGRTASERTAGKALLAQARGELAEAIGAGRLLSRTLRMAGAPGASEALYAALAPETAEGLRGLGGTRSARTMSGFLAGHAGLSFAEEARGRAKEEQAFYRTAAAGFTKADLRRRLRGLGYRPGFVAAVSGFLDVTTAAAAQKPEEFVASGARRNAAVSASIAEIGAQFGAMDAGAQALALRTIASDSVLSGILGPQLQQIYGAQEMGTAELAGRQRPGRRAGVERLALLEGYFGTRFGADALSLHGLGMKGNNVTLRLESMIEETLRGRYGGEDVTRLKSLAVDFLRTGGGNTDREIRALLARLGSETAAVAKEGATPQASEVKVDNAALNRLVQLLSGTTGTSSSVFTQMADNIADLRKSLTEGGMRIGLELTGLEGGGRSLEVTALAPTGR
jgi:hypothetical protein